MNILGAISHLLKWDMLVLYKRKGMVVGKRFYRGKDVFIDPNFPWLIKFGDNVTLTDRVQILAHDASMKRHLNYTKIGKVDIGNRVYIGVGSVVLPGVTIGDNVVIAAGSVVSRDIPSNSVAKGTPAKVTGTIEEFVARKKAEMTKYPCYDRSFFTNGKMTKEKRQQMIDQMKDRFGYCV